QSGGRRGGRFRVVVEIARLPAAAVVGRVVEVLDLVSVVSVPAGGLVELAVEGEVTCVRHPTTQGRSATSSVRTRLSPGRHPDRAIDASVEPRNPRRQGAARLCR